MIAAGWATIRLWSARNLHRLRVAAHVCTIAGAASLARHYQARLADASKTARLRELRMAKIAADAKVVSDEKAIAKPVAPARRKVRKPGAA